MLDGVPSDHDIEPNNIRERVNYLGESCVNLLPPYHYNTCCKKCITYKSLKLQKIDACGTIGATVMGKFRQQCVVLHSRNYYFIQSDRGREQI
jgi:hypothetical protein